MDDERGQGSTARAVEDYLRIKRELAPDDSDVLNPEEARLKAKEIWQIEDEIVQLMRSILERGEIFPGVILEETEISMPGKKIHRALALTIQREYLDRVHPDLRRAHFDYVIDLHGAFFEGLGVRTANRLITYGVFTEKGMSDKYSDWLRKRNEWRHFNKLSLRDPDATYLFDPKGNFVKLVTVPVTEDDQRLPVKRDGKKVARMLGLKEVRSVMTRKDFDMTSKILRTTKGLLEFISGVD